MISVTKQFEVLVVGAGPAGIAAATCAAESGSQVAIVDDNPRIGGQIWRGDALDLGTKAKHWAQRLQVANVEMLCRMRVFSHTEAGSVFGERDGKACELKY